ncbi:MAG: hypothetical protein AB7F50_01660 [Fimbriimonadaceae bacterium]
MRTTTVGYLIGGTLGLAAFAALSNSILAKAQVRPPWRISAAGATRTTL